MSQIYIASGSIILIPTPKNYQILTDVLYKLIKQEKCLKFLIYIPMFYNIKQKEKKLQP